MGGFRKCLLAASALAAMPAPAAAADLCAALDRIIASSRETPAFNAVRRAHAHGEAIVPGFDAAHCEVSTTGIICGDTSMDIGNFDDWPDLRSCLGVDPLTERPPLPVPRDWTRTYVASGLRFTYGVRCLRCAGPAWSRFTVTFEGQGRPAD